MGKVFRPRWWAAALVVVLGGVMVSMGLWQLGRGQAKVELLERYENAAAKPLREITAGAWAEPGEVERAQARGRFDAGRQLLLDNQSHDRKPGYRVWTPMLLEHGGILVVDRGWVPSGGDRARLPALPAPEGEVTVTGYWRTVPEPGLRLEVDNCAPQAWPRIVQYPTVDELRCLYGEFVPGGVLLMEADVPGGFVREWSSGPELSPSKHYAYAAQWFAFAGVLVILLLIFSFRRT